MGRKGTGLPYPEEGAETPGLASSLLAEVRSPGKEPEEGLR